MSSPTKSVARVLAPSASQVCACKSPLRSLTSTSLGKRPLSAAATAQPELGISWQPATLIFLAGGTAPYTLGFGRDDARPASQPLEQVAPGFSVKELGRLEAAQLGDLQESAAKAAAESLAAQAASSASRRAFILWFVLLLGVAVLGGMAWKLIRQMKAASDPDA